MATVNMLRFTHNDANVIAALVQFPSSPRNGERLASLEEEDARQVGEVLVGIREYSSAPPEVQATVDRYRAWVENNKRLRLNREARQRSSRAR
jgi:hypothetical protein